MKNTSLKSRLVALALLAAFVVTLFAPAQSVAAAGASYFPTSPNWGTGGVTTQRVNWNGDLK